MKKTLLIAAAAAMLAVSCQKTDVLNEVQKEIGFSTEIGKGTKAPISGTTYPTNVSFGVFAYALTGNANWGTSSPLTNVVMNNIEISYQTDTWKATSGSYFWPSDASTKLSFFAYSPKNVTTTFTAANGITFTSYTNDGYTDLMYGSVVDLSSGQAAIAFSHALAQVLFTVKTAATYTGVTITVKSIKFNGINSVGTFSANASSQWSSVGTTVDTYKVYENTTGQAAIATTAPIGDALVMIPQTSSAMTFTIVYDIAGTGVANETVTKTIAFGNNWARNQKITYNLSIGLNEITFTPTVIDWTPVTPPNDLIINN